MLNLLVQCDANVYYPQDQQLQQIVDKTIMEADKDGDGKLDFEEFAMMVSNTVRLTLQFLLLDVDGLWRNEWSHASGYRSALESPLSIFTTSF